MNEPNNVYGVEDYTEYSTLMAARPQWNDLEDTGSSYGYVAELEPVPEPSTLSPLCLSHRRRAWQSCPLLLVEGRRDPALRNGKTPTSSPRILGEFRD